MKKAIKIVQTRLDNLKKDLEYNKDALKNNSLFDMVNTDLYAKINELEFVIGLLNAEYDKRRSKSRTGKHPPLSGGDAS